MSSIPISICDLANYFAGFLANSLAILANYLANTVDACRAWLFGVLSFVFEGAEVNEPQEKVLEKNGRFGTINGAVNL